MFLSGVHNQKLPSQKMKIRSQRDSNPQILIRSQTPYPLGHAAIESISKWIDLKRSGCRCFTAKMINFFSKNYLAEKLHAVNHDVFICCA